MNAGMIFWSLILALVGALLFPAAIFVGVKLNYKGLRTDSPQIPKDARFYRAFALFGGASFGILTAILQTIDDYGIVDRWTRSLILTASGMLVTIPIIWYLARRGNKG